MLELGLNVPGAKSICHVLRLSKHIMNHGVNNIQGARPFTSLGFAVIRSLCYAVIYCKK
jgi:hypothetical protein